MAPRLSINLAKLSDKSLIKTFTKADYTFCGMPRTIDENKLLIKKYIIMAMKIRMINVYDQKATIIYSDDRDLLIRNLLEVFCIEENDAEEKLPKNIAYITTPYKVEFSEELHGKLFKAITDIKRRAIDKIIISSMFEDCEVQTITIERR